MFSYCSYQLWKYEVQLIVELTNHDPCYIMLRLRGDDLYWKVSLLKVKTLGEKARKFPLLINQPYTTIVYNFFSWLDPKIDNSINNLITVWIISKIWTRMRYSERNDVRDRDSDERSSGCGILEKQEQECRIRTLPHPPPPPPLQTLFKISWDASNTEEKLQQESQKCDHF